jgi:quercetin dioxygenase-like cupin family protein
MPENRVPRAAQSTIQIDNDVVRVTEWRFPSNSETGWHVHDFEYVVVPMNTGQLTLHTHDGAIVNELTLGSPYHRPAGSEHNVVNDGNDEFVFIEMELK